MPFQNGASVLVTDGSKALFLRNEGDAEFPDLRLTRKWEQEVPADRELRTDAPGHVFSSHDRGVRRSAYDETNLHDRAEEEFTLNVADFLNDEAQLHSIDELIIVAPPRTLGELRKHLRREVADRVTGEIAKDLVKHPIASIEQLIASHFQAK
jgi:protein required for attachment to host cells